jgi:hypothetical protein
MHQISIVFSSHRPVTLILAADRKYEGPFASDKHSREVAPAG